MSPSKNGIRRSSEVSKGINDNFDWVLQAEQLQAQAELARPQSPSVWKRQRQHLQDQARRRPCPAMPTLCMPEAWSGFAICHGNISACQRWRIRIPCA